LSERDHCDGPETNMPNVNPIVTVPDMSRTECCLSFHDFLR
jgi:hypothetical protein